MCWEKTGRACRPTGGGEPSGEAVRDQRASCLQAAGDRKIDQALSTSRASAGAGVAATTEEAGAGTAAIRVSTVESVAGTRGRAGQSQAGIPAVSAGRIDGATEEAQ